MAGFVSRDDIINEISVNGKSDVYNFSKLAPTAAVVGIWQSLWKGVGQPGAGADPATTPGTIRSSDQTTQVAGSMWFPDRSTDLKFITSFGCVATQTGSLMLYDRLTDVSAVSVATTGAKTVNSGAVDHYSTTLAVSNECWLEWTTAATTTPPVLNLNSYTSADGTTAQSGGTVTVPLASSAINCMTQMPLSATKQGVRSVEAGLNVGTAAAAGAANVIVLRRLAVIPLIANIWNEVSFLDDVLSLPRVYDNATLGLAWLPTVTTAVQLTGTVTCAYG